ncbi:ATP-binding protein [Halorubrum ezzemoulense]|uniref:ATP-binding protein n=1 Tax=Halorubrum ezzemoulense TaxID=337243 RepID=UPI00232C7F92|nr:ATP-binding protein [Halorubrum ezzemoulense]MDB9299848.1 ATP-binding protein [Halorubrum ezzemoulense]
MEVPPTVREHAGVPLLVGIGGGLFATHVWHAVGEEESAATFLLGIVAPMLFAAGVVGGGVWLWRRDTDGEYALRVGSWSAVGAAVLAVGGVLVILYQQQYGVVMDEQAFVVVNAASGGALLGFIVGVYDIRQRRAEERATRLTRQLTVLNRVLRHDIRTNANVIQGNASLLTEESVDTDEKADTIRQQATDLVKLGKQARSVEQILTTEEVDRESQELTPTVEACCERVRRDNPSAEIDVSLPPTVLVVAHRLIDSALANVIENAVEHNDKETPRVRVETEPVSRNGTDYVELRVADNGPGIAESEIEVLKRGYETDLEHTSGLGFWLVSWIVARSGGEVRFEENDPEGSVVCLRLARADGGARSVGGSDTAAPAV